MPEYSRTPSMTRKPKHCCTAILNLELSWFFW